MPGELIKVDNGRPSVTGAVVEIVKILNPLGTAAEIIATVGACSVELGRILNERQALERGYAVVTDLIRTRQGAIIGLFEARMRDSEVVRVNLQALQSGFANLINQSGSRNWSDTQYEILHGTIRVLASQMSTNVQRHGDGLIRLSEALDVEHAKLTIAALRALGPGQN